MVAEVYRDASGEWRWRLKARNGRIVADSAEGYKRRGKALNAVHRFVMDAKREIRIEVLLSRPALNLLGLETPEK
jgi:uncharacterized protein YegP (UPF0339 family)